MNAFMFVQDRYNNIIYWFSLANVITYIICITISIHLFMPFILIYYCFSYFKFGKRYVAYF